MADLVKRLNTKAKRLKLLEDQAATVSIRDDAPPHAGSFVGRGSFLARHIVRRSPVREAEAAAGRLQLLIATPLQGNAVGLNTVSRHPCPTLPSSFSERHTVQVWAWCGAELKNLYGRYTLGEKIFHFSIPIFSLPILTQRANA